NQPIEPIGEDTGMYAPAPMPEQQPMAYAPAPTEPMEKPKTAQQLRMERMLASNFNSNVGGATGGVSQSAMGLGGLVRSAEDDEKSNGGNGGLARLNNVMAFAGTKAGKMGN